jgi:hypothetical protein
MPLTDTQKKSIDKDNTRNISTQEFDNASATQLFDQSKKQ